MPGKRELAGGMGWLLKVFCCSLGGVVLVAVAAQAVECERRACRSGGHYRDGYCHYRSGFPTYARSHSAARCPAGYTLDRATGICSRGCRG